jgi:hypothetical protein
VASAGLRSFSTMKGTRHERQILKGRHLGRGLAASAGLRSLSAFSSAFRRRDTGLCCFPGSADGSTPTSDFSFTSFASLQQAFDSFCYQLSLYYEHYITTKS